MSPSYLLRIPSIPRYSKALACIAFKQSISQDEIDHSLRCRQARAVVKLRDLMLVEEFGGDDGRLRSPQPKRSCSASGCKLAGIDRSLVGAFLSFRFLTLTFGLLIMP